MGSTIMTRDLVKAIKDSWLSEEDQKEIFGLMADGCRWRKLAVLDALEEKDETDHAWIAQIDSIEFKTREEWDMIIGKNEFGKRKV